MCVWWGYNPQDEEAQPAWGRCFMADAFISYRRKPSEEFANLLQEKLKTKKVDAFIDTQRLEKGEFSPQLVEAIKNSPNFICLLANGTLDSEWVRKEIQLAYEQGKHFVPVFLHHQGYQYDKVVPYIKSNPAIAKLFEFQGVEVHNVGDINYYAERIAKLLILKKPYLQRVLIGSLMLLWILFSVILIDPFNHLPLPDPTNTVTVTTSIITAYPLDNNTPTPTLSAEQLALMPVARNEDWIPYEREIDGVTMVLVPVGSFVMGSTQEEIDRVYNQCVEIYGDCNREGFERETQNGDNTQTFLEPFWIDKYEVSQMQFKQFNGQKANQNDFLGDDLPVENITWFEAQAYCELRGGRLPTEAEWEYAARGPNGLIYPWGDEFDGTRTNFCDENCSHTWRYRLFNDRFATTAPIYSYPEGVSWVGAYQMAGNVWEWTSSIYSDYPYKTFYGTNNSINYVQRGGAWLDHLSFIRSSYRSRNVPTYWYNYLGFRCVRDFEG